MAGLYDINDHLRGDTWNGLTVQVLEGEDESAPPMNITGASIRMQVKTTPGDVARINLTTENGITITNASEGRFQVAARVVDLLAGSYRYDVQLTKADGTVITVLSGNWDIVNDTTR